MTAEKKELASEDAKEYVPETIKPIRYSVFLDFWRITQPAIGVLISADQLVAEVNEQIIFFFYLFLIALISTYAYMGVFVYISEAVAQRRIES
ncbi:hypothetical protein BC833DRAFT_654278 [Globomyces pollinis-pini]|nr:hypothetical protein BC833DRAFT_654278 [Globomyces pollinis-pini]